MRGVGGVRGRGDGGGGGWGRGVGAVGGSAAAYRQQQLNALHFVSQIIKDDYR